MRNAAIAAATCWLVVLPCVALADRVAGERKADLCLLCHGAVEGKPLVPILDGQPTTYFIAQIAAYQTGKRTDLVMNANAAGLSTDDLREP
jgi:cytochrome c553